MRTISWITCASALPAGDFAFRPAHLLVRLDRVRDRRQLKVFVRSFDAAFKSVGKFQTGMRLLNAAQVLERKQIGDGAAARQGAAFD